MRMTLPAMAFERLLLATLVFITFFALLPWQPQGPFDARDWSHIEGVSLSMPWWQMLIEPFSAFGHILTGSPDFRLTAASIALWVVAVSSLWVFLRSRYRHRWQRGLWATAVGAFGFFCTVAMILLFSHLHFPGWQLKVDKPGWAAADLQSHTVGSHDALVRAAYSLQWHRQRGYDVVAVTEHYDPAGSFYAEQLAQTQQGPLVIPGVEMVSEYDGYLLGIGLKPDQPLLLGKGKSAVAGYSRRFVENVTHDHQGAVISMAWLLKPEDIEALANDGVDAFELVNAGHPDIPDSVRNEMLRLEREGRVRLVGSSDWHGWGGNARTWTLLKLPGLDEMGHSQQVAAVVALLREGGRDEVIPVAAGYQGEVSPLRLVLAPLVESARYAAELSPSRLLGWWLWGALLWLLSRRLRAKGVPPGVALWAATLLLMGGALVWSGIDLYRLQPDGDVVLSDVTAELGLMAMQAALPLLMVGGWLTWRTLSGRGARQ